MEYFIGLFALIFLSAFAYWRGNPVVFMLSAGVAIMLGFYTPDALSTLGYSTFGIGVGLMLIFYAFVCIAMSYANIFREKEEED